MGGVGLGVGGKVDDIDALEMTLGIVALVAPIVLPFVFAIVFGFATTLAAANLVLGWNDEVEVAAVVVDGGGVLFGVVLVLVLVVAVVVVVVVVVVVGVVVVGVVENFGIGCGS